MGARVRGDAAPPENKAANEGAGKAALHGLDRGDVHAGDILVGPHGSGGDPCPGRADAGRGAGASGRRRALIRPVFLGLDTFMQAKAHGARARPSPDAAGSAPGPEFRVRRPCPRGSDHVDRDVGGAEVPETVGDPVLEVIRAGEVEVRTVRDGSVPVVQDLAMRRLNYAVDGNGVPVRIGVVGEEIDHEVGVLVPRRGFAFGRRRGALQIDRAQELRVLVGVIGILQRDARIDLDEESELVDLARQPVAEVLLEHEEVPPV